MCITFQFIEIVQFMRRTKDNCFLIYFYVASYSHLYLDWSHLLSEFFFISLKKIMVQFNRVTVIYSITITDNYIIFSNNNSTSWLEKSSKVKKLVCIFLELISCKDVYKNKKSEQIQYHASVKTGYCRRWVNNIFYLNYLHCYTYSTNSQ